MFFEDETNNFLIRFDYIFFCFLLNKRFLARILKLPPEKYNVKGLHVNSYITVNRRAAPKDSPRNIMEPFDEESFGLVSNVRLVLSCRTSKFFLFSVLLCCHRRFSFYFFFFRFRLFVNCKYLYKFITLKVYIFIYILYYVIIFVSFCFSFSSFRIARFFLLLFFIDRIVADA